jgi:hypothetical protein
MPCPLLTTFNLARGIHTFLRHPKWRQDFHNRFYANVTAAVKSTGSVLVPSAGAYKPAGYYGPTAWHDIVFELWHWRALRPHPTAFFHAHPLLVPFNAAYAHIGGGLPYKPLPVANPPQTQLSNLFTAATALKPVATTSAVFPSKCCHMLLPWEFPIWDNQFAGNTGTTRLKMLEALESWKCLDPEIRQKLTSCLKSKHPDYWCYRYFILLAWDTLPIAQQTVLINQLNAAILAAPAPLGVAPWPHFPYRTKIPELCLA